MHKTTKVLLFLAFLETLTVFQIIIYSPFILHSTLHAKVSSENIYVAFFLMGYPLGLVLGNQVTKNIVAKYGRKMALIINLSVTIVCLFFLMFSASLLYCFTVFGLLGAFGSMWSNIFGCFHECPSYLEFEESDYWLGLLSDSNQHKILWYLQTAQGMGVVFSGFMGGFYRYSRYGAAGVSTPFVLLILLAIIGLVAVHMVLDDHYKEVQSIDVVKAMTGVENITHYTQNGGNHTTTPIVNTASTQPLLLSASVYGGVNKENTTSSSGVAEELSNGNGITSNATSTMTSDPRFIITDEDEETTGNSNKGNTKTEIKDDFEPIKDTPTSSTSDNIENNINVVTVTSEQKMSWLKYFPLLAGGYFENLSAEENTLDETLIGFIVAYMNSRLFLCLLFSALNIFVLIFAFDILFPTFSAIPNTEGGMGWTPGYVGLFYTFYGITWMLTIWYRWYRLHMGYQLPASFKFRPIQSLKIAFIGLFFIYAILFPWCINSPHIHHADWGPSSWVFLGFLLAVIMGILSAVLPYEIAQMFRDFAQTIHGESVETAQQQLAIVQSKMTVQILLSTLMVYVRICGPVLIQWAFIFGWDLNSRVLSRHTHSKRDWYQIGNFVFYMLACLSGSGFAALMLYEKWRRDDFGEQAENEEMSRLIEEVRQEQNRNQGTIVDMNEDSDALGFWISSSMKACVSKQTKHPVCKTVQVCMKDNFEKWRAKQNEQQIYNSY